MIETAIHQHLAADAGVSALVGDRIYPDQAPESADMPFVVYQRISTDRARHMGAAGGLANPRIQIDVYAPRRLTAGQIADAIREAMDGFRGTMGTEEESVRSCFLDGEASEYERPVNADDVGGGTFRQRMDFVIWHTETVPTFS